MHGEAKVENPERVEVTISLTMTLHEWEHIVGALGKCTHSCRSPEYKLNWGISELVNRIRERLPQNFNDIEQLTD